MTIINHGTWSAYLPNPEDLPEFAPPTALYARRDSDGLDWYSAIHQPILNPTFAEDSVLCACEPLGDGTYRVQPATKDPTTIFPQGMLLIEITDYEGTDPWTDFHNKIYNPDDNTLTDPPPVVFNVQRSQIVQQINEAGKMKQLKAFLDSHEFEKEMWYATTMFHPTDKVIQAIIKGIDADPAFVLKQPPQPAFPPNPYTGKQTLIGKRNADRQKLFETLLTKPKVIEDGG